MEEASHSSSEDDLPGAMFIVKLAGVPVQGYWSFGDQAWQWESHSGESDNEYESDSPSEKKPVASKRAAATDRPPGCVDDAAESSQVAQNLLLKLTWLKQSAPHYDSC